MASNKSEYRISPDFIKWSKQSRKTKIQMIQTAYSMHGFLILNLFWSFEYSYLELVSANFIKSGGFDISKFRFTRLRRSYCGK